MFQACGKKDTTVRIAYITTETTGMSRNDALPPQASISPAALKCVGIRSGRLPRK
jgi:hypothetical protein